MAGRSVNERKAWEWSLFTDLQDLNTVHVEQAYRTTFKPCRVGNCRVNCKGNPNCLNHLGEAKWLKNTGEQEVDGFMEHVRPKGSYCGLKNLGATCYVNSLLQVWFHNIKYREAIFSYEGAVLHTRLQSSSCVQTVLEHMPMVSINVACKGETTDTRGRCSSVEEPPRPKRAKLESSTDAAVLSPVVNTSACLETISQSVCNTSMDKNADDKKSCKVEEMEIVQSGEVLPMDMSVVIGQLQILFVHLQSSKRRVVDPTGFIDSLHLQHSRQQDAQEFRKLFLSQLGSSFKSQASPALHGCIDDQFRGKYAYVTKCGKCANVSAVDSDFYELELNVQGCKSLKESLAEFFKEESLDSDNQYFCAQCSSKQDAKRFIQLKSLPPELTLQLLRFVFDFSLLAKVKVTSYLCFPDELDLSGYLGDPSAVYRLSSFIVHCGPSAYAGHYIAHVKDHQTGTWYNFDDGIVEEHKKDRLIIGSNEDTISSDSLNSKKPRCPKDHHMSNSVYMLMYKRVDTLGDVSQHVVPSHLQKIVDTDNVAFESTLSELRTAETLERNTQEAHANEMKRLYAGLSVRPNSEQYDWICTSWLKRWLGGSNVGVPEHKQMLCKHNKLSLNAVTQVKRVNSLGLSEVYERLAWSWDPLRLTSDMLCQLCVTQRCKEMQLKHEVETDNKAITKLLKSRCTSASGFWVGKKSLQTWRKLYLDDEGDTKSAKETHVDSDPSCLSYNNNKAQDGVCDESKEQSDEALSKKRLCDVSCQPSFNSDILCQHGNLCIGETKRRLVSVEIWTILQQYFPEAESYTALHTPCLQCLALKAETEKENESVKSLSRLQKEQLSDLYYRKNRPQLSELGSDVFALPMAFVENWTSFVRFPISRKMPNTLCVDLLLCQHDKLSLPISTQNWATVSDHVVLVWPEEWHKLLQWYTSHTAICIHLTKSDGSTPIVQTSPEVCEECSVNWKPESETGNTSISNYIYVYHPQSDDREEQASIISMLEVPSKSMRKRVPVGAEKIIIDFSQSLFQLQINVMNLYGIPPRQQRLYYHGNELVKQDVILSELGLESGCVVILKEVSAEENAAIFLKETTKTAMATQEDGFKGTGLLS